MLSSESQFYITLSADLSSFSGSVPKYHIPSNHLAFLPECSLELPNNLSQKVPPRSNEVWRYNFWSSHSFSWYHGLLCFFYVTKLLYKRVTSVSFLVLTIEINRIFQNTCTIVQESLKIVFHRQNLQHINRSLEKNNSSLIYKNHWLLMPCVSYVSYLVYLTAWVIAKAIWKSEYIITHSYHKFFRI